MGNTTNNQLMESLNALHGKVDALSYTPDDPKGSDEKPRAFGNLDPYAPVWFDSFVKEHQINPLGPNMANLRNTLPRTEYSQLNDPALVAKQAELWLAEVSKGPFPVLKVEGVFPMMLDNGSIDPSTLVYVTEFVPDGQEEVMRELEAWMVQNLFHKQWMLDVGIENSTGHTF